MLPSGPSVPIFRVTGGYRIGQGRRATPSDRTFQMLRMPVFQNLHSLFMALSATFVLAGYEFIRNCSHSLFKKDWGSGQLPFIMSLTPLILIPALWAYNRSISRFGVRKTFLMTQAISMILILGCFFGILQGLRAASALLFLIGELYIILIVEQVWSFMDSTNPGEVIKKMTGSIQALTSVGALAGGLLVHLLAGPVGTRQLLLIGSLFFLPGIFFAVRAFESCKEHSRLNQDPGVEPGGVGFRELLRNQKLLAILAMVVISQIFATIMIMNFQLALEQSWPELDEQTAASGLFFSVLHGVALGFQLFLCPLAFKRLSHGQVLNLIPFVNMLLATLAAVFPAFPLVALCFLIFKALDYSLFRAARELMYIPLNFNARYRTKELIDVLGYRSSKCLTSIAMTQAFPGAGILSMSGLSTLAAGAAMIWGSAATFFFWSEAARNLQKGEKPALNSPSQPGAAEQQSNL